MLATLTGPLLNIISSKDYILTYREIFGELVGARLESFAQQPSIAVQENIWLVPVLLGGLALVQCIARVVQTYLWESTSENITYRIRHRIFDKFTKTTSETKPESMSSLINVDSQIIKNYITRFIGGSSRELVKTLFLLYALFVISWKVTLGMLLLGLPVALVIKRIGKKFRRRTKSAISEFSEINAWLEHRLGGIKTIKQYDAEELENNKFREFSEVMFQKYKKAASTKATLSPVTEGCFILILCLLLAASYYIIQNDLMDPQAFVSYVAGISFLSQSANKLSKYYTTKKQGDVSIGRIKDFLKSPSTSNKLNTHGEQNFGVKVSDMSLAFGRDKILDKLNYHFKSATFYIISGASGVGKSSLVRSLVKLLPQAEGDIKIGVRKEWDHTDLAYITQHAPVLDQDIDRFVSWPDKPNPSKTQRAKELACIDFENSDAKDQDSVNLNYSGGQLQRLHLARLFYHEPKIIIMDETTSALDLHTEAKILKNIKSHLKKSCIISIAHREQFKEFADVILELKHKKLSPA